MQNNSENLNIINDNSEKKDENNKNSNIIGRNSSSNFNIISNNNNKNDENNKNDKNKIEYERSRTGSMFIQTGNKNKLNIMSEENKTNIKITGRDRMNTISKSQQSASLAALGRKHGFISLEEQEIINNNNDYYSLFQETYVQDKLKEKKDNCDEKNIYSDQIYLLVNKKKLSQRLIMLTPSNIFIIEPKEARFTNIIEKKEISSIAISNKNLTILVFQLKNNNSNIVIQTLRRMDLLFYLREHYRKSDNPIAFKYEDKFKTELKGKTYTISVKDKIFTAFSNFDGALKIGYLLKLNTFMFTSFFSQRLVVLTSIGLIVFDDPLSPPEKLYPIIGSNIKKVEGEKYNRPNCFEIEMLTGEVKVFAAYKEGERNSWLEEFEKLQKDFQSKMKKLDTVNKLQFIDNRALENVKEEENEEEIIPKN